MENIKKFYIETFGCQMNEFDSERIVFILSNMGLIRAASADTADLIVINTCSVRKKAENRLYGHIGNLKTLKDRNPALLICIGGCTAQSLKDKIIKDFPYVDIVFGTANISRLPFLLAERNGTGGPVCNTSGIDSNDYDDTCINLPFDKNSPQKLAGLKECNSAGFLEFSRSFSFKACLPIIIGCNNFCSYCIVPYVRGRERSVEQDTILNKVKNLVENEGVVEITLLGQNVNSYGLDFPGRQYSFAYLLEKVAGVNGLKRIRFMTSHPKDFSDDLISVIRDKKNIMKHIHLPLQSGSDRILGLMNRKYTIKDYILLYGKIKAAMPDCAVTTDIITGFPGEQEGDFMQTLKTVKYLRFNRAFTFLYSLRKGTAAEQFPDHVPLPEKKKWFAELIKVQNKISLEENAMLKGKQLEALVEGKDIKESGLLKGRLENNNTVHFYKKESSKTLAGKFVLVKITDARSFYLTGEAIK